jgi:erythromycin esterase-like protein
VSTYWDNMSPEERSAEMKKRRAKAKANGHTPGRKKGTRNKNLRTKSTAPKVYACKHCGQQFPDRYKLANHVRYTHGKKRGGKRKGAQLDADEASQDLHHQHEIEKHAWYLFGKVETHIDLYSASSGVPRSALAKRVGELLRHQEGG